MIEEITALFGALGDASRLRILRSLLQAQTPQSQGELVAVLGLSQATTSKHLACLVRAGLVVREAKGNTAFYTPVQPLVTEICDLFCGHATAQIEQKYKNLK